MPLVLMRKPGESVEIRTLSGERIKVTVGRLDRAGQARLIFDAPQSCVIHRSEVWDQLKDEENRPPPAV